MAVSSDPTYSPTIIVTNPFTGEQVRATVTSVAEGVNRILQRETRGLIMGNHRLAG